MLYFQDLLTGQIVVRVSDNKRFEIVDDGEYVGAYEPMENPWDNGTRRQEVVWMDEIMDQNGLIPTFKIEENY